MTEAGSIVVIEDDPAIADLIELYLRREGFAVYATNTGERGLELIEERSPRAVVLDLGLAGAIDGLDVCRRLRSTSFVPVVMVTARDDEIDRVVGLEAGADDYLIKPFSPRELIARVRAVLRRVDFDTNRSESSDREPLEVDGVVIGRARPEARAGDEV
ncbi:MAG: response regulator transcription factor, partial [Actinobacteria bacterium]|nr:response regulator transcription factor [Actinomycetota bacterium]